MAHASGTFDITSTPEPPVDSTDGVVLGRMTFEKTFHSSLQGTSTVHMTYARTADDAGAGYVAVEKIRGEIDDSDGGHTYALDYHLSGA